MSTTTEDTTGGNSMCQLETFDALPGAPDWFNFGEVSTADGELKISVDPPASTTAGLRTATAMDLTTGSVTAVLTELPALDVATTAFSLVDEIFENENGYALGIINGVLRVERTVNGAPPEILQTEDIEMSDLPATLRFETSEGQLTMTATSTMGGAPFLTYSEAAPSWTDDAYISINAGNPSENATMGELSIDSLELCPGL